MSRKPRYRNTTSQISHKIHHDLAKPASTRALEMADNLRMRLTGFYHAIEGSGWSSQGRAETDYLQHINIVIAGDARVIHSTGTYDYEPGQIYWCPGNTPVVRECKTLFETCYLTFRFEWLGGFDPFMEWPDRRPVCLGPWAGTFDPRKIDFKNGLSASELWQLRAQAAVWLAPALDGMKEILSAHQASAERFRPVLDHLEADLGADLRIEDMAKLIGLSARAFSMAFTRALGISPKAYVSRRLNQEAIRLVLHSGLAMKEIADELRFADEYHFNRFFQENEPPSPMRYRSAHATLPGLGNSG